MSKGLASSRWASGRGWTPSSSITLSVPPRLDFRSSSSSSTAGTPTSSTPQSPVSTLRTEALRAEAELGRYTRIVRRMKWKLPSLGAAYQLATAEPNPAPGGGPDAADVAEAALMFKLDFFEFYMLLERALVHLQLVFGVVISREHDFTNGRNGQQQRGGSNGSGGGNGYAAAAHRYHANVLAALDSADHPLHGTLGTAEVRRQLGRAKDLRNRWKNADAPDDAAQQHQGRPAPAARLESYDLENILGVIFDAFDCAFRVAERHVAELSAAAAAATAAVSAVGGGATAAAPSGTGAATVGSDTVGPRRQDELYNEEDQWAFMVDAMDWEAV